MLWGVVPVVASKPFNPGPAPRRGRRLDGPRVLAPVVRVRSLAHEDAEDASHILATSIGEKADQTGCPP